MPAVQFDAVEAEPLCIRCGSRVCVDCVRDV